MVIGFELIEQVFEVMVCRLKGNKLLYLMIFSVLVQSRCGKQ
jgi:hypothetical protein